MTAQTLQDEIPTLDTEEEETTEVLEGDDPPQEEKDSESEEKTEEPSESEEIVIAIDGEEPEAESEEAQVPWVRQLRKENRELKRKQREYERQMADNAARSQTQDAESPGAKPTLEGCDFDGEVFAQRLEQWHESNSKYQAKLAEQARKQEAERESWNKRLQFYATEKSALKVPDYEEAEENVLGSLSATQQGLILKSKDPAKLVYALGKSPKKLAELATITDPVDFVYAVAEVQGMIKVQKRAPPPVTDRPVRGAVSGVSVADQQLEKLREQARKTGDYTAYHRAKEARKG